jgi:hypothetical protein
VAVVVTLRGYGASGTHGVAASLCHSLTATVSVTTGGTSPRGSRLLWYDMIALCVLNQEKRVVQCSAVQCSAV